MRVNLNRRKPRIRYKDAGQPEPPRATDSLDRCGSTARRPPRQPLCSEAFRRDPFCGAHRYALRFCVPVCALAFGFGFGFVFAFSVAVAFAFSFVFAFVFYIPPSIFRFFAFLRLLRIVPVAFAFLFFAFASPSSASAST